MKKTSLLGYLVSVLIASILVVSVGRHLIGLEMPSTSFWQNVIVYLVMGGVAAIIRYPFARRLATSNNRP